LIAVISTSCRLASAALFSESGGLLEARQKEAPRAASQAIFEMLAEWPGLTGVVADAGPGSFTGVKTGVTAAKTLAWAQGLRAGLISSFDLIAPDADAAVLIRRGVWIARHGGAIGQHEEAPEGCAQGEPLAERAADAWSRIEWMEPMSMTPRYLLEPSISLAKKPLIMGPDSA
jgi:hypothetical protein